MIEHTFRQSWLGKFWQCPEQARLLMLGGEQKPPNGKMMIGTVAHAMIEAYLQGQSDVDASMFGVNALDSEEWEDSKFTYDKILSTASSLFTLFVEDIFPTLPKGGRTEVPFNVLAYEDKVRKIYLKGTADYVTDDCIYDWKTSTRAFPLWEYERWSHQAAVYSTAFGIPNFNFEVMVYPALETQSIQLRINEGRQAWLVDQLLGISRLIEADLPAWPQNDQGWHCHPTWCASWADCKGAFVSDDWVRDAREERWLEAANKEANKQGETE